MSLEPPSSCIICANTYSSPNHVPISFRCGHTFCSTCIQNNHHYKTFADTEGLCVVDRTEVLKGAEGRVNKCFFSYINFYQEDIRQSIQLMEKIQQNDTKNEELSDDIYELEKKYKRLDNKTFQLEEKLQSLREKKQDYQEEQTKDGNQYKELFEKYQKLRKINEIKQARMDQLRYQLKQLKSKNN